MKLVQRFSFMGLSIMFFIAGCGSQGNETNSVPNNAQQNDDNSSDDSIPQNELTPNPQGNISYLTLRNRDPDCGAYTGSYHATILDHQQGTVLISNLNVSATADLCTFTSNNIPNHDVGQNTTTGGSFATKVTANVLDYVVTTPRNPVKTNQPTYIGKVASHLTLNGIMLNGVDLDMDSAFCYHPDFTSDNHIGLNRDLCGLFADWYAIPAANPQNVVLDEFTGHAFDGRYHYHGDNHGLSELEEGDILQAASLTSESGSPLIGFAPDGFPIYGHYFYDADTNTLRKAKSGWRTFTSERETVAGSEIEAPGITTHPRGMFVEDWYFESGSGDLDECNGMTDAYGNYGYYYTEDYPYGPLCTYGVPDPTFVKPATAYDDGGAND